MRSEQSNNNEKPKLKQNHTSKHIQYAQKPETRRLTFFMLCEHIKLLQFLQTECEQKELDINNYPIYYLDSQQYTILIFNYILKALSQFEEQLVPKFLSQAFEKFGFQKHCKITVYFIPDDSGQFRYKDQLIKQFDNFLKAVAKFCPDYKFEMQSKTLLEFENILSKSQSHQQKIIFQEQSQNEVNNLKFQQKFLLEQSQRCVSKEEIQFFLENIKGMKIQLLLVQNKDAFKGQIQLKHVDKDLKNLNLTLDYFQLSDTLFVMYDHILLAFSYLLVHEKNIEEIIKPVFQLLSSVNNMVFEINDQGSQTGYGQYFKSLHEAFVGYIKAEFKTEQCQFNFIHMAHSDFLKNYNLKDLGANE